MSTIESLDNGLTQIIQNRHSVRVYEEGFQIPREELETMLQEATLAPSSSNLQSWRFLVVDDPKVKEALFPVAYHQKPIVTSSAVIVLLGDLDAYKNVNKIYEMAIEKGFTKREDAERLITGTMNSYPKMSEQTRREVAILDGGLVAMQLMLIAKAHGYDTLPMGGFSSEKLVELFDIPGNLAPIMLIAVGKMKQEAFQTVRLPLEDVTYWNSLK